MPCHSRLSTVVTRLQQGSRRSSCCGRPALRPRSPRVRADRPWCRQGRDNGNLDQRRPVRRIDVHGHGHALGSLSRSSPDRRGRGGCRSQLCSNRSEMLSGPMNQIGSRLLHLRVPGPSRLDACTRADRRRAPRRPRSTPPARTAVPTAARTCAPATPLADRRHGGGHRIEHGG